MFEVAIPNSDRWFNIKPYKNEIFKDITIVKNGKKYDYTGYYQISNYGRIKALSRNIVHYNGQGIYNHKYKEKIKKISKDKNYYFTVMLSKNSKQEMFFVHRLVANAFIENPNNLPCVNHIKEVSPENCNNHFTNLFFCTQQENINQRVKNNRSARLIGSLNKTSKPILLLDKNNNIVKRYENSRFVAKEYNMSPSLVCQYLKNKIKNKKINIVYEEDYKCM